MDYEVELSPLSQTYTDGAQSVEVAIYKAGDDEGWILEVVDGFGNSMIADEMFATAQKAWNQFLLDVKKEGIEAFIDVK